MRAEREAFENRPAGHALDRMIVRQWHGRVPAHRGDAYIELMKTVAIPDYRGTHGNLGAFCLHRRIGDVVDVTMLSWWRDRAAIEAFAGRDITAARYYPFDAEFLLEKEPHVTHYEAFGHVTTFPLSLV